MSFTNDKTKDRRKELLLSNPDNKPGYINMLRDVWSFAGLLDQNGADDLLIDMTFNLN